MGAIRDIRSQLSPIIALEPQTINTDTTTVGEIIDTKNYDGGIVFTQCVNYTTGTFTPLLEESDSDSFATSNVVADTNLIGDVKTGQEADAALSASQLISSLGVVNNLKRYLRLSIVSTDSADGIVSAVAHGKNEIAAISNP
ncbi:MAG: hypothetical protein JSU91_01910 [Thermoplasmatales archaeon]|nr:MAG: hypothetical protein JSU91_01910 [Thermoplasmatales archaeon]